jgi:hypothetical protein
VSAVTLAYFVAASACFLSDAALAGAAFLAGGTLVLLRDMIEGRPPCRRPRRKARDGHMSA